MSQPHPISTDVLTIGAEGGQNIYEAEGTGNRALQADKPSHEGEFTLTSGTETSSMPPGQAAPADKEYFACTDCGAETDILLEASYQVRNPVWEQAYPGYRAGVGIGDSRPCIGCLESRLGRQLTRNDFTRGNINEPDPAWHSVRLMERLSTGQWTPWGRSKNGAAK